MRAKRLLLFNSAILLISFSFILPNPSFARSSGTFYDTPPPSDYKTVSDDFCDGPSECANSENPNNCNLSACTGGIAWAKYDLTCKLDEDFGLYYEYYEQAGLVCSIGDKYNSSNPPVLDSGTCTCGVTGGPYKTCCSGRTQVNATQLDYDGRSPPEGACPGGTTTVRCGPGTGVSCGQAACNTLGPPPTPIPPPCPTDKCEPASAQCTSDTTRNVCTFVSDSNCPVRSNGQRGYYDYSPQACPTCTAAATICTNGVCGCEEPTCNISADPQRTSAFGGFQTTISWDSKNATDCSVSPRGWSGTSGKERTRVPNKTTFTATCNNSSTGKSGSCSVTVNATGTCPNGSCSTSGQTFCSNSSTLLVCQWNFQLEQYCYTKVNCPAGTICDSTTGQCEATPTPPPGGGGRPCPNPNFPFSCNNQCWSNPCQNGITCTAGGAVCNPTPTATPTPTARPTPPPPPPSCTPMLLGPTCSNICTGQTTCGFSSYFLFYPCTGGYVCLNPQQDSTCTGGCAPTSISGAVFLDKNEDGKKQPPEGLYSGNIDVTVGYTPGPYRPSWCSGGYHGCLSEANREGYEDPETFCSSCKYPPSPTPIITPTCNPGYWNCIFYCNAYGVGGAECPSLAACGQPCGVAPTPTPDPVFSSFGNVTAQGGTYKIANKNSSEDLPEGSYTVNYSKPASYLLTEPITGSSFTVRVGASCTTGGSKNATCFGGSVSDLHFGLNASNPWFQSIGADIRIDSGFSSEIPKNAACGSYASLAPSGGTPGLIFSGSSNPEFGEGEASTTGWQVGDATYQENYSPATGGLIRTSYAYLRSVLKQADITPTDIAGQCAGGITNCALSAGIPNGVYISNGSLTLTGSGFTFPTNKNYVILVNGDLNIREKIFVPRGSTVTFSVSGNIYVDSSVGEAAPTSTTASVEGYYSADKNFIVQGTNNCGAGADRRFNLAGAIVTNAAKGGGSFQLQRDLCGNNRQCPSFSVIERVDFALNAPQLLRHPNIIWEEAAP